MLWVNDRVAWRSYPEFEGTVQRIDNDRVTVKWDSGTITDPYGSLLTKLGVPADEVRIVDPKTGGEKGQKGAQLGAVDPMALLEIGKVAGFGATKYARYNFAKGYAWSLSYDAMQRHLAAFWNRTDKDDESGLYHLAHAAWHCLTLLTFSMRGLGTDDRFPQGEEDA